jgi:hypothetical protein
MNESYRRFAASYRHGYSGKTLEDVLSGFNLDAPAYEQRLEPGSTLYQFVRRASIAELAPRPIN